MKKFSYISVLFLLAALFGLMLCADGLAETKQRTYGDDGDTSVFYVISNGNCELYLSQNKGTCYELSYTQLINGLNGEATEWGKYHIYCSKLSNATSYHYDWDDTYWNGNYTVNLPESGLYKVEVVPYGRNEMGYLIDVFNGWKDYPYWWVNGCSGGSYQQENPCKNNIYVEYRTTDGSFLSSEYLTKAPGTYNISATNFGGMEISGNSSYTVTVNEYGIANRSTLTFFYKSQKASSGSVTIHCYCGSTLISSRTEVVYNSGYIYAPEIYGYTARNNSEYVNWDGYSVNPGTLQFYYDEVRRDTPPAPSPTGRIVKPYLVETQFCPQYSTHSNNSKLSSKLSRLNDGSTDTKFNWYIVKSERTDNIPEFTFYFNNETVSGIKIINGDIRGSSYFERGAKYNCIRFVVYDQSGAHTEYVYPSTSYITGYQTLNFSKTYSNVYRIEFWHEDADLGSGDYLYELTITDLQFIN